MGGPVFREPKQSTWRDELSYGDNLSHDPVHQNKNYLDGLLRPIRTWTGNWNRPPCRTACVRVRSCTRWWRCPALFFCGGSPFFFSLKKNTRLHCDLLPSLRFLYGKRGRRARFECFYQFAVSRDRLIVVRRFIASHGWNGRSSPLLFQTNNSSLINYCLRLYCFMIEIDTQINLVLG